MVKNKIKYRNKKSQVAEKQSLAIPLWSIADSNRLPQHCQCCALPDELMPRIAVAKVIPFFELTNFCTEK